MKALINWINNHPGWSWLIGIIVIPAAIFGIGYTLAFWLNGPFPDAFESIIKVTQFLVFIAPVVITYWSINQRKINKERENHPSHQDQSEKPED